MDFIENVDADIQCNYAPIDRKYIRVTPSCINNGYLQLLISRFRAARDIKTAAGDYTLEWVRIQKPDAAHLQLFQNSAANVNPIIGECILGGRAVTASGFNRIYIVYPIVSQATPHAVKESLDSCITTYYAAGTSAAANKDERPFQLNDLIADQPHLVQYTGPTYSLAYMSTCPMFIENESLFRHFIATSIPLPLEPLVPLVPLELSKGVRGEQRGMSTKPIMRQLVAKCTDNSSAVPVCTIESLSFKQAKKKYNDRASSADANGANANSANVDEQINTNKTDPANPTAAAEINTNKISGLRKTNRLLKNVSDQVNRLTSFVLASSNATTAKLDDAANQVQQAAIQSGQTGQRVDKSASVIAETARAVNQLQAQMNELTDGTKIMLNADGTYSKIATAAATVPIQTLAQVAPQAVNPPQVVNPRATTPPDSSVVSAPPPPATSAAATSAATSAAATITTTETTGPLESFYSLFRGPSGFGTNKKEGLNVSTGEEGGTTDEMECYPTGSSEDEIEMYNIPVGSAYAGILSQNAMTRMGAVLMVMTVMFVVALAIIPIIYTWLKTGPVPNAESVEKAGGFLVFIQLSWIILLIILGLSFWKNASISAGAFSTVFILIVSLAFTVMVVIPKDETGTPNIQLSKFINAAFELVTNTDINKSIKFVFAIIVAIFSVLLSLKFAGVFKGSLGDIITWVIFGLLSVITVVIGVSGYRPEIKNILNHAFANRSSSGLRP